MNSDELEAIAARNVDELTIEHARDISALLAEVERLTRERDNAERQVKIRSDDSIADRIARQNVRAVEEWVATVERAEKAEAALARVREAITSHQFGEQDADDTLAAITDATIHGGDQGEAVES